MKRLLPLLLSLLLAVSLAVPAFAEEDSGSPSPDTSSSDTSTPASSGNSEAASDSSASNSFDAVGDSPAYTSADTPDTAVSADATTSDEGGVTVNVTIQQAETSGDESAPEDAASSLEDIPAFVPDDSEDAAAYRTFTVISQDDGAAVSSSGDSSVMADVVVSILGEYQRKTQTVTEMDSEGNVLAVSTEIVPGLAGLDYEWIAGAVLFALFLYGLLRIIGGLIKL